MKKVSRGKKNQPKKRKGRRGSQAPDTYERHMSKPSMKQANPAEMWAMPVADGEVVQTDDPLFICMEYLEKKLPRSLFHTLRH